jgi:hypothetical protein
MRTVVEGYQAMKQPSTLFVLTDTRVGGVGSQ